MKMERNWIAVWLYCIKETGFLYLNFPLFLYSFGYFNSTLVFYPIDLYLYYWLYILSLCMLCLEKVIGLTDLWYISILENIRRGTIELNKYNHRQNPILLGNIKLCLKPQETDKTCDQWNGAIPVAWSLVYIQASGRVARRTIGSCLLFLSVLLHRTWTALILDITLLVC